MIKNTNKTALAAMLVFLTGCTEIPMPKFFGSSGPENAVPVTAQGTAAPSVLTAEQRIAALETSVAGMQKDISGFMPYLKKIDGIEADLRALVTQLQAGIGETKPAEPGDEGLAVKNPAPPEVFDPNGPPMVRRVRIGNNGATTRIVLDVTKKTAYRHNLDNAEKILVIELPDAGWASDRRKWDSAKKSKLIAAYSVQEGAGGKNNMLVIQLRKETQIVKEGKIDPVSGKDYRIYLDLKS